ncbi:protein Dom3Z-like protein [Anopheles sinensis]|uniref:Protein Dom3Z-like protein n=1 Tax=Anopheles sinensis TaxID=74873 RepID=A0A084WE50_ANOSI|nr:protein Dom3Z-like protein [Anopheles sinensis]
MHSSNSHVACAGVKSRGKNNKPIKRITVRTTANRRRRDTATICAETELSRGVLSGACGQHLVRVGHAQQQTRVTFNQPPPAVPATRQPPRTRHRGNRVQQTGAGLAHTSPKESYDFRWWGRAEPFGTYYDQHHKQQTAAAAAPADQRTNGKAVQSCSWQQHQIPLRASSKTNPTGVLSHA